MEATTPNGKATHGYNPAQVRALTLLKHTKPNQGLTRAVLAEKSGVAKGWSRILGAATKDAKGASGKSSLMAKGLIQAEKHEGEPITYVITANGRKALAAITAK